MEEEAGRLPLVTVETDDPRLRAIFDSAAGQQGLVSNLYRTLANAPAMLGAWTGMAWPLRHAPALDRRTRELAIMRVAQRHRAVYEWAHHWHLAEEFGLDEERLRALGDWRQASVFDERERTLLAYVDAVVDADVPDSVFDPLRAWFDESALVELTLTITFYCHVSRALIALRIPLEPGFHDHVDAL